MSWDRLVEVLAENGRTIAVAESFTGGRLAAALTEVPGASRVFQGGALAYADHVKREDLGVRAGTLAALGAVSEPVAIEMAAGARRRFRADLGLATTGIAGPSGATDLKPVGLSLIGLDAPGRALADRAVHPGGREEVQRAAVEQARRLLEAHLRWEGVI